MTQQVDSVIDQLPSISGARCLVLGGGGFIGLNLSARLFELGAEVKCFGRSCSVPGALDHRMEMVKGTFDDRVAVATAVQGQDFVFHLISGSVPASSNHDPAAELTGGPLATIHLLDICRSANVRKIIFASSGGTVYGVPTRVPILESDPLEPIAAYGISKILIEKYLHLYKYLHGLDYHALRIANPYGKYQLGHKKQGVVATIIHRALTKRPVEVWGTGEVTRDFIHVNDVVDAFLAALSYSGRHRVMNVGSGVGTTINKVLADVANALEVGSLPRIVRIGRAVDVPINVLDTSLLTTETGWQPRVSWDHGLRDTVNWMRAFEESNPDALP